MKFAAKELKEQKLNLKANKPVKVHLALELDSKTKNVVGTLNYRLSLLKKADIKFYNSVQIPHITLISGVVKNNHDFNEVKSTLSTLLASFKIGELDLKPTKYYFSKDGTWLLLGLQPNEFLTNLTNVLKDFLRSYIEFGKDRDLHITVTRFAEDCSEKLNLKKLQLPQNVHVKTAIYGLSGKNGVLLNKTKSYKI